jgi:4-hydroxy-tetrahydrodipicolinate reductase
MTMTKQRRVGVIGAHGRMGSQTCRAVDDAPDLELAARVGAGDPLDGLVEARCDVVVDFTRPEVVMDHVRFAVEHRLHCVVGTTGFTDDRLATVRHWLGDAPEVGVTVVPNFAIGAVLAIRFARTAARFFESAEVIEEHHAGKVDAPSGTAVAAARAVAAGRSQAGAGDVPDATSTALNGSRGAQVDGIHTHAIRMPGRVAHLQVLLGNTGETLTIRHDSIDRVSFMPGVLAAIRTAPARPGLTVGLERVLEI